MINKLIKLIIRAYKSTHDGIIFILVNTIIIFYIIN